MKKISALLFGIIFSMLSLMAAYATNLYIPMITSYTASSSTSRVATVSLAWTTTGSLTPPEFFMVYKTGTGNSYSGTLFV